MAQSGIRKGFFFYFGLLVLVLVAVVLVCMTIMIFSPGTSVLWMKYFTYSETYSDITDANGAKVTSFSWDGITKVTVNAESFADVTILSDTHDGSTAVSIENNAKGFAKADASVEAAYEIKLDGTELFITVDVPTGFLNISTSYTITINSLSENRTFTDVEFDVTTGSGTISLSYGAGSSNVYYHSIGAKALSFTTTSGDVIFNSEFITSSLNELNFTTKSGEISFNALQTSGAATFSLDSGAVSAKTFTAGGDISISNKSGTVAFENALTTSGSVYMNDCITGNYTIGTLTAEVIDWSSSTDSLTSPYINIGSLNAPFVLSSNNNASPTISIDTVNANIDLVDTAAKVTLGSVVAGELNLAVESATITYASGATATSDDITATENSVITFEGATSRALTFVCSKNITLYLDSSFGFIATAYTTYDATDEAACVLKDSKIKVNIHNEGENNPLTIGTGSSILTLVTTKTLTYNNI